MQLIENKKFNKKKCQELISREDKFITELFEIADVPDRRDFDSDDLYMLNSDNNRRPLPSKSDEKPERATSHTELHKRLEALKGKKKLSYKEKLVKKGLKNRMKKKTRRDDRNAEQKLLRAQKATEANAKQESDDTPKKPVFNVDDKIVYSKFGFDGIGKKKEKKQLKDPKKLLEKLKKQKETIEKLQESGEIDKAIEVKEKTAWKNALAKAEGTKVRDDATLLKKTLRKQKQKVKTSKKKWDERLEKVQKAKDERQEKRTKNLDARNKSNKNKKLKKAANRGRIIPGF